MKSTPPFAALLLLLSMAAAPLTRSQTTSLGSSTLYNPATAACCPYLSMSVQGKIDTDGLVAQGYP